MDRQCYKVSVFFKFQIQNLSSTAFRGSNFLLVIPLKKANSLVMVRHHHHHQADGWLWCPHQSSSHEQSPPLLDGILVGGQNPHPHHLPHHPHSHTYNSNPNQDLQWLKNTLGLHEFLPSNWLMEWLSSEVSCHDMIIMPTIMIMMTVVGLNPNRQNPKL